jgi:hypothetical protein
MSTILYYIRRVKAHMPAMRAKKSYAGDASEIGTSGIVSLADFLRREYGERPDPYELGLWLPARVPTGLAGTDRFEALQFGPYVLHRHAVSPFPGEPSLPRKRRG